MNQRRFTTQLRLWGQANLDSLPQLVFLDSILCNSAGDKSLTQSEAKKSGIKTESLWQTGVKAMLQMKQ
jgi:hypothetical protein